MKIVIRSVDAKKELTSLRKKGEGRRKEGEVERPSNSGNRWTRLSPVPSASSLLINFRPSEERIAVTVGQ